MLTFERLSGSARASKVYRMRIPLRKGLRPSALDLREVHRVALADRELIMARTVHQCEGDILIVDCVDHATPGLPMHVDVRTFMTARYLGAWSLETQEPLEGLIMTEPVINCLEGLTYKDR